jgi:chemotaxis protein histidine kinase CheA
MPANVLVLTNNVQANQVDQVEEQTNRAAASDQTNQQPALSRVKVEKMEAHVQLVTNQVNPKKTLQQLALSLLNLKKTPQQRALSQASQLKSNLKSAMML